MTLVILGFVSGVVLLQLQPELPGTAWLWLAPICIALAVWRRALAVPLAIATGFLWATAFAHVRMADRLAPELEGRDLEVVGVVAGLPAASERGVRFEFEVESADAKLPSKILLSWYRSALAPGADSLPAILDGGVHAAERWRFTVRLRAPHGNFNPHGFDYEAWLMERGIGATGYVRPRTNPQRLGVRTTPADRIEQAREHVRERFKRLLGETPAAGILAALAVGDQRSISAEEWRLFNRTGVTHLMSISGLHVTLVSGLFAWLVSALWRRVPALVLALAARKAAAIAAIIGALGYTLIAGFAVPAQRTFWMVTVVALALWAGRISSPVRTLALALGVVVALDPWAVLGAGAWLSFGAVALIFYVAAARPGDREKLRWLKQALRTQWAVTLGLAPAALFLFSQISIVGPLANAVAIPLVSLAVTPLALAAALLPLDFLAQLAAWLLEQMMQFLEWCAALPAAVWQQHVPPPWAIVLALAGVAWMLAPRGIPWRGCGLALLAPGARDAARGSLARRSLDHDARRRPGARGGRTHREPHAALRCRPAVLRRHRQRRAGDRTLSARQRNRPPGYADRHAQRHGSFRRCGFRRRELRSRRARGVAAGCAPAALGGGGIAPVPPWCRVGVGRRALRVAASGGGRPGAAQDERSFVRAADRRGRALDAATGDIERASETLLVARSAQGLRSDVLLVPHHGSKTSSSDEFLEAVAPAIAVIPIGYRNRFGHPNAEVLERYAALRVKVLRTDRDGAITVRLDATGLSAAVERERGRRYWHPRWEQEHNRGAEFPATDSRR